MVFRSFWRCAGIVLFILLGAWTFLSAQWPHALIRSFYAPDACTIALQGQVDLLVNHYSTLLAGVTHVALLSFPVHPNLGDSAIWAGEKRLLHQLGIKVVYEPVCFPNYKDTYNAEEMRAILEPYRKHAVILLHGGGNFGDLYLEHVQREQLIRDFPDYPIRSFPQTIFFQDQDKLKQAIEVCGQHKDLQLAARDAQSLAEMRKHFGKHKSVLLPDMATMLVTEPPPASRNASKVTYLVHARQDYEGGQVHSSENERQLIETQLLRDGATFKFDDWLATDPVQALDVSKDTKAEIRLGLAWKFLTQGDVAITDRLHAHILSTLWNLPHVALETGEYKKLERYHTAWLTACSLPTRKSTLVHSMEEALIAAKQMLTPPA
ncbi:polysaccharide pyruvyl transferase-domain-containing protein [Protomyces lactucae-debilis]|uniref:Polysaccharide pyruvyl transferase-domain-containing protein n=1 Tax=Protomyces lactucae-debilis TaxID=2754530 RepID=A0A1Y2F3R4_PROLT|nr:polysaccharide pyruvyl transferase-domain-containing protein [Protomyces lactucae-debilis]ORY78521.1 polysaccharide pyruvyl transferase-domain-containing protein [Protomyces lactucae-debilis]